MYIADKVGVGITDGRDFFFSNELLDISVDFSNELFLPYNVVKKINAVA